MKEWSKYLEDVFLLLGMILIVIACFRISVNTGLFVSGVFFVFTAFLISRITLNQNKEDEIDRGE
ncbi:DUF1056 domain-containing protein [Bacillus altitudinis]|uniref:DUF1056 domain-containing protein n=1 Tax=Bacillus altitudinis TaxID=293387 RepID=UPI0025A28676|nr:DUF1056 domain-containing protein [Bacillus altitudinis]MDM5163833.1 DUF1056 domain-containing protein [Bacillus altitudinis]